MMDSCLRFISIFLILHVSFVCTTGNTNLEINIRKGFLNGLGTYTPQSVKRRHIAQTSNRPWSPVYVYNTTDTSDFVFPEHQSLTSRINERVDTRFPNQSAAPKQGVSRPVALPSTCHQWIPLSFDSMTEGFVFPAASKINFLRPLTEEEIVSIQQLKMKSG